MWESEDAKARDEQVALQQSLMDATRAMRALEKYSVTDWTEQSSRSTVKQKSTEETTVVSSWPTPPYIEDHSSTMTTLGGVMEDVKKPRTNDYFRFGIPSPRQ
jgi:hypothetical protein